MPVYYMNEGAFELPEVARDRTTHVVEMVEQGHDLTLIVSRSPLPEGKSLRQAAQGLVLEENARLSGYLVLAERETTWADVPALEIASRWRHEGRAIYQVKAHLALGTAWTFFGLSAPFDGRATADACFDRMRQTIRLRA